MIKKLSWIFLVFFMTSACEQSAPIVLPTPTTLVAPQPTPTCYVIIDVTSAAIYPVELVPLPGNGVFYQGQEVETAVTGGVIKWTELQICGNSQRYLDDFERTISIQLADQPLVEFVCEIETCPVTFTIPSEIPIGSTKMVVQSGTATAKLDVLIQAPGTPSP